MKKINALITLLVIAMFSIPTFAEEKRFESCLDDSQPKRLIRRMGVDVMSFQYTWNCFKEHDSGKFPSVTIDLLPPDIYEVNKSRDRQGAPELQDILSNVVGPGFIIISSEQNNLKLHEIWLESFQEKVGENSHTYKLTEVGGEKYHVFDGRWTKDFLSTGAAQYRINCSGPNKSICLFWMYSSELNARYTVGFRYDGDKEKTDWGGFQDAMNYYIRQIVTFNSEDMYDNHGNLIVDQD